jgi:hypothetical protein
VGDSEDLKRVNWLVILMVADDVLFMYYLLCVDLICNVARLNFFY